MSLQDLFKKQNKNSEIPEKACSEREPMQKANQKLVIPQSLYIFAWRKYWLIAMSSLPNALFNNAMTFESPFMIFSC